MSTAPSSGAALLRSERDVEPSRAADHAEPMMSLRMRGGLPMTVRPLD